MTGKVKETNAEQMEAWPGPVHSYKAVHIASTVNNHRVCSIACAGVSKIQSNGLVRLFTWTTPNIVPEHAESSTLSMMSATAFLISCWDAGPTQELRWRTRILQVGTVGLRTAQNQC